MSQIERRRSSVSTRSTESPAFVTPLATPSQLSHAASQLDLNEVAPREDAENVSEKSGTVTPKPRQSVDVAERPRTAVYTDSTQQTTDSAQQTTDDVAVKKEDVVAEKEQSAALLSAPEQEGEASKATTLGGRDSSRASEKEEPITEKPKTAEPTDTPVKKEEAAAGAVNVPDNDDEIEYPGGLTLGLITLGLLLATFVVALDNTIIATAIPQITTVFDSLNDVGWYGSSYLLCTTSLQPSFGKIYTFVNIKYAYLTALVIFEVGSIVCATANSSVVLIIGRAIAGVGASGLFSGGMTIIGYTVPLRQRAIFIALLSSMFGIASVVGPLIGGVFTDAPNLTWRWCFWINLPFGGVALATVFLFFKNPKRERSTLTFKEKLGEMDLLGAAVLIGGVVCLLLALQWGGSTYPWSDSRVWGCFLGFGLLITLFIGIQAWKGDKATIPPRIMKQRTVAAGCAFSGLLAMGLYALIYYLPFYFQAVKGTSAEGSGIRTIPLLVSNTLAAIVVGGVITWSGYYVPFLWVGSAIFTAGCGVLYLLRPDDGAAQWIGYQLLAGIGSGACIQIPFISVQVVLSAKDMPTGNALTIFFNTLGGALSVSIAQNIFSNRLIESLSSQLPSPLPEVIYAAGATHVRDATPAQFLDIVLEAYNNAIVRAFILSIAVAAMAFLTSFAFEWRNIKGKKIGMGAA